ncbi:PucR family transcriptional regulator [Gracilibacillus thailandensis]|uniref:PucR family transcriptional regulator n=1 Tax=Gracilibacillus thailandensis TaxID=563735 RepID=A0A6N7R6I4_9BACI|nr:PucR family transcriptional regulator [Gracilibacillus thailandensis]MRI68728.1 hypothetical protein [Gracilibacillus thailandensis]
MHLTIKEALTAYPFSQSRLVAGENITQRSIKAVNIIDAPDIQNWVKEGELLLTTAYILQDNMEKAIQLIKQLDKKRCAGLAIKLGRYWKEIPQTIIDTANQLDFPIFELPYSYTFSDQIKALYYKADQQKEMSLRKKILSQIELPMFEHHYKDIDQYLMIVAKFIKYPFVIFTTDSEILYNKTNLSDNEILKNWFEHNYEQNQQINHIELKHSEMKYGDLLIINENREDIIEEDVILFEQIGEILTDYLSKVYTSHPEAIQEQTSNILLKRYLEDEVTTEYLKSHLSQKENKLLQMPYWIILIDHHAELSPRDIASYRTELEVHPHFKSYKIKHLIWNEYLVSIIFDSTSESRVFQKTNLFLPVFDEILKRINIKQNIKLVVSKQHNHLNSFSTAINECLYAKELAKDLQYNNHVIIAEDLDFFSLYRHIPDPLMETFYKRIFEIFLHDSTNFKKDMLVTLEAYLECNGNIKEVAHRLFVHRNTVIYRLDKVSSLLKINLKNIDDLLRIKMAFTFLQIKNIRQHIS